MRIFITPGSPNEASAYFQEILHAFGLCFTDRCPLQTTIAIADPHRDLILLPRGSEAAGIEPFLKAGGSVIAVQPPESVETIAGVVRKSEDNGPARLRFTQPVCHALRG